MFFSQPSKKSIQLKTCPQPNMRIRPPWWMVHHFTHFFLNIRCCFTFCWSYSGCNRLMYMYITKYICCAIHLYFFYLYLDIFFVYFFVIVYFCIILFCLHSQLSLVGRLLSPSSPSLSPYHQPSYYCRLVASQSSVVIFWWIVFDSASISCTLLITPVDTDEQTVMST